MRVDVVVPNVAYEVRVLPANQDRQGRIWQGSQFSEWASGRTSQSVPGGPVLSVMASSNVSLRDSGMAVSWLPPEAPNGGSGTLVSYNLSWRLCFDDTCRNCSDITGSVVVPVPSDAKQALAVYDPKADRIKNPIQQAWVPGDRVGGLTAPLEFYRMYAVSVLPSTAVGPGLVWSSPVCARSTPGLPSAPRNFMRNAAVTSGTYEFTWGPPAISNGVVEGYLFEACSLSPNGQPMDFEVVAAGDGGDDCECVTAQSTTSVRTAESSTSTDASTTIATTALPLTIGADTPAINGSTTTSSLGAMTTIPTAAAANATATTMPSTSETASTITSPVGTTNATIATTTVPSATTTSTVSSSTVALQTTSSTTACACQETLKNEALPLFTCNASSRDYLSFFTVLQRAQEVGRAITGTAATGTITFPSYTTMITYVRAKTPAGLGPQSKPSVFNTSASAPTGNITRVVIETPAGLKDPESYASERKAVVSFDELTPAASGGPGVSYLLVTTGPTGIAARVSAIHSPVELTGLLTYVAGGQQRR